MKIDLENIELNFQNEPLFSDLNLTFDDSRISSLLGRSGSGKTTILKIIAGLIKPENGQVWFNEVNVTDLKPQQRDVGWVPQQQLLFPHMDVKKNLGYGLSKKNMSKKEYTDRIDDIAGLVGVKHLLERVPDNLSGGERQRVALGRALAPDPQVLLLDEPFSSLDASERDRLSLIFRDVQLKTDITTVFVTHSSREAELLSDEVFILSEGKILQNGTILELQNDPKSSEVAKLLDITNYVEMAPALGVNNPCIIPSNAISLRKGNILALVLSVTRDRIYLKIGNQILEAHQDQNFKSGEEIKIEIDKTKIHQL